MQRFEASTLNEACKKAANALGCMLSELEYNIIQYPKKGLFGLFSKPAIIEVIEIKKSQEESKENLTDSTTPEIINEPKEPIENTTSIKEEEILDSFFNEEKKSNFKKEFEKNYETISAKELEEKLKKLFSKSCFDIDTIEVDIEDNTAYVFIDGEDAALLIGKEGYRYNALSYIIFNWINAKYGLYLKLEIAQFLASQQDMIKNLLTNVVDHVKRTGWGKTKPLNGILVQIALEYLRDTFPDKYIAIKTNKDKEKYIVINEFNKR
jgi:spoIIIJ-associated protein